MDGVRREMGSAEMRRTPTHREAPAVPRGAALLAVVLVAVIGCRGGPSKQGAIREQPSPSPVQESAAPPAAPSEPAAAPAPEPATPSVAEVLGLSDPSVAEEVGKLLDAAAKSLAGEPIPDADALYRYLEQSITETRDGVTFKRSPDEISRGAGAILEAREQWGSEAEVLLRRAADRVQQAKWGFTSHAAKAAVLHALTTLHPSPAASRFRFHADLGLAKPTRPLACPESDPRWSVTKRARYFEDKTFVRLQQTADAALPDGAIREAVALLAVPVTMNEFLQGGSGEVPPLAESVVSRYGERALGCLFEALAHPVAASAAVNGSVESLRYNAQLVAKKLPLDASLRLYRAALQAGWTDWARDMPTTSEHQALAKELGEGPYLPAFQSPYRLPAPSRAG